jgi:hypothetical protein
MIHTINNKDLPFNQQLKKYQQVLFLYFHGHH